MRRACACGARATRAPAARFCGAIGCLKRHAMQRKVSSSLRRFVNAPQRAHATRSAKGSARGVRRFVVIGGRTRASRHSPARHARDRRSRRHRASIIASLARMGRIRQGVSHPVWFDREVKPRLWVERSAQERRHRTGGVRSVCLPPEGGDKAFRRNSLRCRTASDTTLSERRRAEVLALPARPAKSEPAATPRSPHGSASRVPMAWAVPTQRRAGVLAASQHASDTRDDLTSAQSSCRPCTWRHGDPSTTCAGATRFSIRGHARGESCNTLPQPKTTRSAGSSGSRSPTGMGSPSVKGLSSPCGELRGYIRRAASSRGVRAAAADARAASSARRVRVRARAAASALACAASGAPGVRAGAAYAYAHAASCAPRVCACAAAAALAFAVSGAPWVRARAAAYVLHAVA